MSAYGAQFELSPREKGMKGAIESARSLAEEIPNSWIPMQFDNEANTEAHRRYWLLWPKKYRIYR